MATSGQAMPPPPLPPKKNISPIIWIVGGLFALVVLAGIAMIAGGLFLAKTVHDAAGNPALAAAKMMAMSNSDVEILSSDDAKGTVTFRDKKTGKILTMNFEQIKQGKIEFAEDGKTVTMESSGEGLSIKGVDGSTVQVGGQAGAKMPEWLPAYPGAVAQGTFAMQGGSESGAAISFTTKDAVEKVSTFYQDAFKNAGLSTTTNMMTQDGKTSGGIIAGESADRKRSAVVNIASGDDGITVGVTYSDKK
ncbi:MAG TPA: hypothetical protein VER03_15845 [Bryobacteraceae bacterium]|nr:hypothetical protein [Bryobacteraceae bacterium]